MDAMFLEDGFIQLPSALLELGRPSSSLIIPLRPSPTPPALTEHPFS